MCKQSVAGNAARSPVRQVDQHRFDGRKHACKSTKPLNTHVNKRGTFVPSLTWSPSRFNWYEKVSTTVDCRQFVYNASDYFRTVARVAGMSHNDEIRRYLSYLRKTETILVQLGLRYYGLAERIYGLTWRNIFNRVLLMSLDF